MNSSEALNRILTNSCCNPEDSHEFVEWMNSEKKKPIEDRVNYQGWSKFEIELCCMKVTVIARHLRQVHNENGFDYNEYKVRELVWG